MIRLNLWSATQRHITRTSGVHRGGITPPPVYLAQTHTTRTRGVHRGGITPPPLSIWQKKGFGEKNQISDCSRTYQMP